MYSPIVLSVYQSSRRGVPSSSSERNAEKDFEFAFVSEGHIATYSSGDYQLVNGSNTSPFFEYSKHTLLEKETLEIFSYLILILWTFPELEISGILFGNQEL